MNEEISNRISILREIVRDAGDAILKYYGEDLAVDAKADNSPLTQADVASHQLIVARLREAFPEIPIVSEEDNRRLKDTGIASRFWLVDPMDGTKEFIKQTGSFTVNIGLIESGIPTLGIIYVPVSGLTYWAERSAGAWKCEANGEPVRISAATAGDSLRFVASRDHAGADVKALVARFPEAECLSIGSSLKFCLIAEGAADIYLRDVPTMEWDTAAAQAIVAAAGGEVYTHPSHVSLTYGKSEFRNGALLTVGDRDLVKRLF